MKICKFIAVIHANKKGYPPPHHQKYHFLPYFYVPPTSQDLEYFPETKVLFGFEKRKVVTRSMAVSGKHY